MTRHRVVTFDLAIDGRVVSSWAFDLSTGQNFLQVWHLPDGIPDGPGPCARLTIAAAAARGGGALPPATVTPFNAPPARVLMYGPADGWYVGLPAADILSTNCRIAVTTDHVYLPGEAEGTTGTGRLGVRVCDSRVNPVGP